MGVSGAQRERRRISVSRLLVRLRNPSVDRVMEAIHAMQTFGTPSRSAIHRDMVAVRRTFQDALQEEAPDLYVRAVAEIEEARSELWRLYGNLGNADTGLKLAVLQSLMGLHDKRVRLGQTLGLVVKEPERAILEVEAGQALKAYLDALTRYMSPDCVEELGRATDALEKEQPEVAGALASLITQ